MPIYEVVSKIFWTDVVKITKLNIRPIGCHHPRSSSLPHVDTGLTISFNFIFGNRKKSQGARSPVMTLHKKVSSLEVS
jgi:hypothetical protein